MQFSASVYAWFYFVTLLSWQVGQVIAVTATVTPTATPGSRFLYDDFPETTNGDHNIFLYSVVQGSNTFTVLPYTTPFSFIGAARIFRYTDIPSLRAIEAHPDINIDAVIHINLPVYRVRGRVVIAAPSVDGVQFYIHTLRSFVGSPVWQHTMYNGNPESWFDITIDPLIYKEGVFLCTNSLSDNQNDWALWEDIEYFVATSCITHQCSQGYLKVNATNIVCAGQCSDTLCCEDAQCKVEYDVEFLGGDIRTAYASNWADCCRLCLAEPSCGAWSWMASLPNPYTCTLKTDIVDRSYFVGPPTFISGYRVIPWKWLVDVLPMGYNGEKGVYFLHRSPPNGQMYSSDIAFSPTTPGSVEGYSLLRRYAVYIGIPYVGWFKYSDTETGVFIHPLDMATESGFANLDTLHTLIALPAWFGITRIEGLVGNACTSTTSMRTSKAYIYVGQGGYNSPLWSQVLVDNMQYFSFAVNISPLGDTVYLAVSPNDGSDVCDKIHWFNVKLFFEETLTITPTKTGSSTRTETRTYSETRTRSETDSRTRSFTDSATWTDTPTIFHTPTASETRTASKTATDTPTITPSDTSSRSTTQTNSPLRTLSSTSSASPTFTRKRSLFVILTKCPPRNDVFPTSLAH